MPATHVPSPRRRRHLPGALALALAAAATLAPATGPRPAAAQEAAERIAAIVNDDVITSQDLGQRVGLVASTSGLPSDPATRARLFQQVLRGYVDEKLQVQEAKRLKIEVTDAEVDRAFANIAQRNRLDAASFKAALQERKIDVDVLRQQIRGQIAWVKVINRELRPRLAVTDDQVGIALKEALAGKDEVEYALSEILLPVDGPGQQGKVMRDAQDLVATLRGGGGGGDFAALARQVSVAASAPTGGDLGWVRPSMVLPELRGRLAGLKANEVSDPIASPVGVHIFKVRERRSGNEPPPPPKRFVTTRVSLAQVVLPVQAGAKEPAIKATEKQARGMAPRFQNCSAIEAYAKKSGGTDGSGALGWLQVKDLPPVLQKVVTTIEPGQMSPPLRGPLGIQMLMVCDRQGREETMAAPPPPPPPPPPTREEMRTRLEEEQLQRLATRYLRELRKDAFIDVRMGA